MLPKVTTFVENPKKRKKMSPHEPHLELFQFEISGAIPTDEEDDVIGEDQAWKIVHERVRFENDDSV